jgi:2-hydroxy-6-oxonona-2,4-dienedioate hydrolase
VLSPEFLDYFWETMTLHHNLLFVHRMVKSQKELFLGGRIPSLRCPTLILWGEYDVITPLPSAREIIDDMSGAALEVFPETKHVPQIEHPEAFNRIVASFLSSPP